MTTWRRHHGDRLVAHVGHDEISGLYRVVVWCEGDEQSVTRSVTKFRSIGLGEGRCRRAGAPDVQASVHDPRVRTMDDLDGLMRVSPDCAIEARLQASHRWIGRPISRDVALIAPRFFAALVASFIVAFSPNAMGRRPPPKSDATSVTIPMELRAGRPVIHVTVNGGGPFLFLVSPEAETTLIDKTFAVKLGLKASRETGPQARSATRNRIDQAGESTGDGHRLGPTRTGVLTRHPTRRGPTPVPVEGSTRDH